MNLIDQIIFQTEKRVEKIDVLRNVSGKRDILQRIKDVQRGGKVPVISEVKASSPSGLNRDINPLEAADIAKEMVRGGAAAISVLTEPYFFNGSIENMESVRNTVDVPVLRKDFIIDKKQIYETDSDMILLIARILGDKLGTFVDLSFSHGLEPLVEVHNKKEVFEALNTNTNIIGVNNRDLDTLNIDLAVSEGLIPIIKGEKPNAMVISESGIHNPEDVRRVLKVGADAVLVGTAIIKNNIFDKTRELVESVI